MTRKSKLFLQRVKMGLGVGVLGGGGMVTLPQYMLRASTLKEDFEVIGDFTKIQGDSIAADATHYKTGTKSLQINAVGGTTTVADKTINWDLSGSTSSYIRFSYYVASDPATTIDSIQVYIASQANYSKYFSISLQSSKIGFTGWNTVNLVPGDWTASGGESWNNAMIRIRIRLVPKAGQNASISVDSLYVSLDPIPGVVLTFDDCLATHYTVAHAYMAPRKLKGSCYVISTQVDTAQHFTAAQMTEMYNAGWDMGNHSTDSTNLTTLAQAQMEANISGCATYLDGAGCTRASKHVAYPSGGFDDTVLAAMTATGMYTGRTTTTPRDVVLPYSQPYKLESRLVQASTTLAAAQGFIDNALARGEIPILVFHNLLAVGAGFDWAIADFQSLMDYIVAKRIRTLTISQLYALMSGPISVPRI